MGDAGACGEAVYAHYCLHRLKMLPSTLFALPSRERAFLYASIDLELANQKKARAEAEAAARKK